MVSRGKARMSDLCEPEDICYHQEHHPGGGALPQLKVGLKSRDKPPPPTVAGWVACLVLIVFAHCGMSQICVRYT